jgi:hypothetical protein
MQAGNKKPDQAAWSTKRRSGRVALAEFIGRAARCRCHGARKLSPQIGAGQEGYL